MIKKIISTCSLVLFFSVFNVYSQQKAKSLNALSPNSVTPPTSGQNSINTPSLTTVLSAAPNAFELTRYSGLPVNMSAGSVNAKIPLGDVKSGKVDVPILLSYNSGNGILLDQAGSRTGMNWTLEAGGVITRTVNGNPDELSTWLKPTANINDGSQASFDYLNNSVGNISNDTQVDIFSFNFNGYSGQFYLDTNSTGNRTKAVLIDAKNLKIETNFHNEFAGSDWTIRITDPQGTKYYFGGSLATETSKTSSYGCGKNFLSPWATAWYLKAIQHYTGEYVWFDYKPVSFDYFTSVSQTIIRTPGTGAGYACGSACPIRTEDQTCMSLLTSTGVILKSISSRFERVNFKYTSRNDLIGDSLLTSVEFLSKGLVDTTQFTTLNNYTLAYTVANNSTYFNYYSNSSILSYRPFLTSVARNAPGMPTQTHQMNYYNINSLASRLSFAQDYWGYFNGANNNNFIPTSNNPQISPVFPSATADREPNGSFAYYGLLSKITYPTKGSDSLQYEPNTIYETRSQYSSTFVNKTATGTGDNGEVDTTFPFNIYAEQNITLNMSCPYSGTGLNDLRRQHLIVTILNSSGTEIYNQLTPVDSVNSRVIDLPVGNYTLKLAAYGAAAAGSTTMFYRIALPPVTANYQVGGVRLLRNISTPLTGTALVKKYVYAALTSQTQSSGRIRYHSDPSDYYSMLTDGSACADLSIKQCTYFIAYSTPLHSLRYYSGGHVWYSNVIELQGDQWANGGIEHQYQFVSPGSDALLIKGRYIPGVPLTGSGFPMGLETLKQTFVTTGGTDGNYTYKFINKVATHYVTDVRRTQFADNYTIRKDWGITEWGTPPLATQFDPFDVALYSYTAQWIYPDTVTTTNYDLAGNNPVKSIQYDVYNNATNLMVSEKHTIGSDGIDQKMVYKYPHEMVAAGNTTPYQAMINDNVVEPVVEQTYYKNNVLLEGLMNNYGDFGNHVYEPSTIQTKTTGSYENRISFANYNINGGILAQSKSSGTPTSYIWGYNNLFPVAEIKNADITSIAYTSFEADVTGNWTIPSATRDATKAITGSQSYILSNGSISKSGLTAAKTYVVSYWTLNSTPYTITGTITGYPLKGATNNGWTYYEHRVTGQTTITISGAGNIDELRLYPIGAQITTRTYNPSIGITSNIDAKGEVSYYEYDNFQRLMNIKDKDGNIIKRMDYHYQGN